MTTPKSKYGISRRDFFEYVKGGLAFSVLGDLTGLPRSRSAAPSPLFWIKDIPSQPYYLGPGTNYHAGVDALLYVMGSRGLKFYRSDEETPLAGPSGLIAPTDVVLLKVNAQWKYRGCTNSDLVRGLVQRILDHPDIFTGEVVICDNGQGWGSLNCDTSAGYSDGDVHANALDETHSFLFLVNSIFNDPRVTAYLLDPLRSTFIGDSDHANGGYRRLENVSYPCFTTVGGRRVELLHGVLGDTGFNGRNLKLINIPVLKYHDVGGSEITAALKNVYGILSMADGQTSYRHYAGLGETCGKMFVSVHTPVLNIIDAIWVSHASLSGYPASTTTPVNQILAGQDPVALDYWAAKHILHPIEGNLRHHPDFPGIDVWLQDALTIINSRGGLADPGKGIFVNMVTKTESEMSAAARSAGIHEISGRFNLGDSSDPSYPSDWQNGIVLQGLPGNPVSDSEGNYRGDVVDGWSGSVKPVKKGCLFTPRSRSYSEVSTDRIDQNYAVEILSNRSDIIAAFAGDGVRCWNSRTESWIRLASPADGVAAGDLDGDGVDDLIGIWPNQGGVWVKHSTTGEWRPLASPARSIASGDMNGDGRGDLLGSWDGQGVFARESATGTWVRKATPAQAVAAGDLDGDGVDDLLGVWPEQGGVWVKSSRDSQWDKLASPADGIACGDMNGDGWMDLLGTWPGQGVFYRDSVTGLWVQMATPAVHVAAGDIDGDGIDDLIGVWPNQGGIWAKKSSDGQWVKLGPPAVHLTAGRIGASAAAGSGIIPSRFSGGHPIRTASSQIQGPPSFHLRGGDARKAFHDEVNLVPLERRFTRAINRPGPGEPGFRFTAQRNLMPGR